MPIFKIARYRIRPEARDEVEQVMKDHAKYIAFELAGTSWVTYRDEQDPDAYVSLISAVDATSDERSRSSLGTKKFVDALDPYVIGAVEWHDYQPVASSL